jgi:hypothetical protein
VISGFSHRSSNHGAYRGRDDAKSESRTQRSDVCCQSCKELVHSFESAASMRLGLPTRTPSREQVHQPLCPVRMHNQKFTSVGRMHASNHERSSLANLIHSELAHGTSSMCSIAHCPQLAAVADLIPWYFSAKRPGRAIRVEA